MKCNNLICDDKNCNIHNVSLVGKEMMFTNIQGANVRGVVCHIEDNFAMVKVGQPSMFEIVPLKKLKTLSEMHIEGMVNLVGDTCNVEDICKKLYIAGYRIN